MDKTPLPRKAYRMTEAAQMIGVSADTFRRWIKAGDITATRRGRCVLVPANEVDRLIGRTPVAA